MAWGRMDDGFDDHPKTVAVLEDDMGLTAIGLWTLCWTWAHRNTRKRGQVPGRIPYALPRRYAGPEARVLAEILVKENLWEVRAEGDGWMIHDFDQYLPTAELRATRAEAGRKGAEARWGKRDDEDNEPEPDGNLPSLDSKMPTASHAPASKRVAKNGTRARDPVPYPDPVPEDLEDQPTVDPSSEPGGSDGGPGLDEPGSRHEVDRVCEHLADRVEQLTGKRPTVGKLWRRAARHMYDIDNRTEEQIHAAIDWCHNDEFWAPNVRSMTKLREKYIQLRAAAARNPGGKPRESGVKQALRIMSEDTTARTAPGRYTPPLQISSEGEHP